MAPIFFYFSVIFCEAVAIYGVIVAIILQTKLESVPKSQIYAPESLRAGYAIFASGIIVGFANLVCGFIYPIFNIVQWILLINIHNIFLPFSYISCDSFFWQQVVCGNHWKQLRIVWCSKLHSFCEDSCDWNLWQCPWFVRSDSGNNYVSSSLMACKSIVISVLIGTWRLG